MKDRLDDYRGDQTETTDSPNFSSEEGTIKLTHDRSNVDYHKQWDMWSSKKWNKNSHDEIDYNW